MAAMSWIIKAISDVIRPIDIIPTYAQVRVASLLGLEPTKWL